MWLSSLFGNKYFNVKFLTRHCVHTFILPRCHSCRSLTREHAGKHPVVFGLVQSGLAWICVLRIAAGGRDEGLDEGKEKQAFKRLVWADQTVAAFKIKHHQQILR